MLTKEEIIELDFLLYEQEISEASNNLLSFSESTMDDFQTEDFHIKYYTLLDEFQKGNIKNLIITMPPQHGKKIEDNEVVLTDNGFKKHGDLIIGDTVFNRLGKPIKVLNILNESIEPDCDYKVTFTDGQSIICHGQHEWVVYDRSRAKEVKVETNYLHSQKYFSGKNNRCRFQVDSNNLIQFDKKELPIHPYLLGLWLGDGHTSAPTITHHADDNSSIDKVISLGYKRTSSSIHGGTGVIVSRFFGDTFQLFKKLDFAHPKGLSKHIPLDYKTTSFNDRLELLAGLIDSDGYVYQKNGRVTFSNINKQLIDDVKDICISLGFRTTICEYEPIESTSGIVGKSKVYQLCFNPDISIPTAIERKKIIIKNPLKRKRGIVLIEKVEPKKGKCITVEGGVYLVGRNLIPTHNSEGSTRRLPAYILGKNPDLKIAIASYNTTFASFFSTILIKCDGKI